MDLLSYLKLKLRDIELFHYVQQALMKSDEKRKLGYQEYLGIKAPNRSLGVLQDVHWSMGAIGYFPTYTLGNLYAAQLLESARGDLPTYDDQIRSGDFGHLLDWMRKNVHNRGSLVKPAELIEEVTGSSPSPDAFVRYLSSKVERLYGVSA